MRRSRRALAMAIVLGFSAACGGSSSSSKRPSPPDPVVNPTPADGSIDVALIATLSWDPAAGADLYAVYFGTISPGAFRGSQPGTTFDPGLLVAGVRYFWKIDAVNSVDITTGAVWAFDTVPPPPAQVGNPSPRDEEGDVSSGAILTWDMATGAASYDVYFGTWNPGSPGSPGALQGNQAGTSFDPGPLANLTRYVWRIDAINAGGTTTGPVWSFTTFPRGEDRTLVVENLQSPTSQAIAGYYRGLRPSTRLLTIDVVEQETVNRATFDTDILAPIETYLVNGGLQDEIWYIVT
ncbi:MAG: hypothetical protein O6952_00770, partial [Planctomycetota bacterium]|nr:hypothetical protein [Planctomycetota bacterium]